MGRANRNHKTLIDGKSHIYTAKDGKGIKTLCNGWVFCYRKNEWSNKHFINGVRQTTSGHLSDCPGCVKLFLPIFRKKQQKYLLKLEQIINVSEEKPI